MAQSPSWESNSSSAWQEILSILWTLELSYLIHNIPFPVPTLSQINPVHGPHSTSWKSILILSSNIILRLPSGLYLLGFTTKNVYALFLFHIQATCPAHFILNDLTITNIFDVPKGQCYFTLLKKTDEWTRAAPNLSTVFYFANEADGWKWGEVKATLHLQQTENAEQISSSNQRITCYFM